MCDSSCGWTCVYSHPCNYMLHLISVIFFCSNALDSPDVIRHMQTFSWQVNNISSAIIIPSYAKRSCKAYNMSTSILPFLFLAITRIIYLLHVLSYKGIVKGGPCYALGVLCNTADSVFTLLLKILQL